MPRFGVIWFISVLLQSAGVIWIIACTFVVFVSRMFDYLPSPAFAGAALTNTTLFTYIAVVLLYVIIGLLAIAAGQVLIVLMAIEENTRIRRQASQRPPPDPDGPWQDRNVRRDTDKFRTRADNR